MLKEFYCAAAGPLFPEGSVRKHTAFYDDFLIVRDVKRGAFSTQATYGKLSSAQ